VFNQIFMEKLRIGALVSSGKDSVYAMSLVMERHNVCCMMTIKSKNPDSFMFQSQSVDMSRLQSESLGIPLIEDETNGVKEEELEDLRRILIKAKEEYHIEGIVTGALYSSYQKDRIVTLCNELGLKALSPLWHMDQEQELRDIIRKGFKFIMVKVAADGLSKDWLGKEITNKDVDKLVALNEKIGINVAFEGGEAETVMIDGPIFKKKIVVEEAEIVMENEFLGVYNILKARLE
jgi:diphthine-ammonia ligase